MFEVNFRFKSTRDLYAVLNVPYLVQAINRGYLGDLAYMLNSKIQKEYLDEFFKTNTSFDVSYIEFFCSEFEGESFAFTDNLLSIEPLVGSIGNPFVIDSKVEFAREFLRWYVQERKIDLLSFIYDE